ncbi:MAG: IPT/TIG domain-containing protein [Terracidiphilus sp.]
MGLSPAFAIAAGAAFTLTISGSNFTPTSTSKWGSDLRKTTFVCETRLTAVVPASLIATSGSARGTITTAAGVSSAAAFTITLPLPAITSLSPATATAGHAFTVTINGRNFASLATAKWGSAPLATTNVTGTQPTAAVPAGWVTAGSKAFVTVSTVVGTSPAAPLVFIRSASTSMPLTRGQRSIHHSSA